MEFEHKLDKYYLNRVFEKGYAKGNNFIRTGWKKGKIGSNKCMLPKQSIASCFPAIIFLKYFIVFLSISISQFSRDKKYSLGLLTVMFLQNHVLYLSFDFA